MNDVAKPRLTSLPLDDPHRLLEELMKPVKPEELQAVDGVRVQGRPELFRSVHSHVLTSVFFAESNESADIYIECCKRLIELQAPINDLYGNGAACQFTGHPWPLVGTPHLTQFIELADLYVAAGLFELEAPMPGTPLKRAERKDTDGSTLEGLKPLAAAIFQEDTPLAAYLLERGVSLDLGITYSGEPPMSAMQLADEERTGEIKALIAERFLQDQMAKGDVQVAPAQLIRRRHSL